MKVKIKFFALLRQFGPDEQVIEFPEGTTVNDVIHSLNIPGTIRLLKIVNGEHRPADHVLKDGDELALFPPIAGGYIRQSGVYRADGYRKKYLVVSR
jgi:molybdopterin converting factor small subunit